MHTLQLYISCNLRLTWRYSVFCANLSRIEYFREKAGSCAKDASSSRLLVLRRIKMKISSKFSEFQRVAYSLFALAFVASAVYLVAVPSGKVGAQKIGSKERTQTQQFAVNNFPTSTALPLSIPDNSPAGTTLTLPVSGLTAGDVVRGVEVDITFDQPAGPGGHTWVGDLDVVLSDPNGTMHTLFSRTGSTTPTGAGDSSDAQGPYTFADLRHPTAPADWWATAIGLVGGTIPADTYRTHANQSATPTFMNPVFTQVVSFNGGRTVPDKAESKVERVDTPDNIVNGNWTLAISDNAGGDTGRVSALSLRVVTLPNTAAFAGIRGGVQTASGRPISNARVTILNTTTNESFVVQTNPFGYFSFEGLPVGVFYTMWVEHGRYQFAEPTRNFTLDGDVGDAVFVGTSY